MGLIEKLFGTIKTENDVSLKADNSLFVFAFFILVLVLVSYTFIKMNK